MKRRILKKMLKNPKMGDEVRVRYTGVRHDGGYALVSSQKNKGALCASWDESYGCREDFQDSWDDWPKRTKIFFLHSNKEKPQHRKAIAAALAYVEKKMKTKSRSVVCPTSRPDITYIKLSKWWVQNDIRKSFLTILLRAAVNNAYKKNFFKSLFEDGDPQGFFKKTPLAVRRFLKGYTKQPKNADDEMWMETFYNYDAGLGGREISEEEVKELLVKRR